MVGDSRKNGDNQAELMVIDYALDSLAIANFGIENSLLELSNSTIPTECLTVG
jgi:hypothetical protein